MKTSKRKNRTGSVLANLAGRTLLVAAAAFALVAAGTAQAALTGFVTIGDPGNDPDSANDGIYGDVAYTYSIGKYEVSDDDYEALLGSGSGANTPKVNISVYGAMEYANALTTDAGGTPYYSDNGDGTYSPAASSHDDYAAANGLTYFVPTRDEWYKAAYYDASVGDGSANNYSLYAHGQDTVPPQGLPDADPPEDGWNYNGLPEDIGIQDVGFSPAEQNGTYDMMGNAFEWVEDTGGLWLGGSSNYGDDALISSYTKDVSPTTTASTGGFRLVAIPEPASGALFVLVGGMLWFVRRRARA